jgi:hypothetical protein
MTEQDARAYFESVVHPPDALKAERGAIDVTAAAIALSEMFSVSHPR